MTLRTIHFDTLLALCQQSSDVILALDDAGNISFLNTAAEAALSVRSAELAGRSPANVPQLAPLLPFVERAHSDYTATRERITLDDGRIMWAQIVQIQQVPKQDLPEHNTHAPSGNGSDDEPPQITNLMGEIVHDMKRPLSSAKSYIDLIEEIGTLSDKQERFAQQARLRLVAMLNQFHQLEDMAWIDSNGNLEISPLDMADVVRRALVHLDGFARQQGVTITVDVEPSPCPLEGDAHRLESVFGNLIHNAIKYSPDGGEVTVTSGVDHDRAVFTVHDQGLGVPNEHIPRLFEQFYRVRSAATARIEGSGMGLSIVKTIVEKHGGGVFVESTPNEGSTFGFWLPCHT